MRHMLTQAKTQEKVLNHDQQQTKGIEMNEMQKIYCDGAAMAYRDCSKLLTEMLDDCPTELRAYFVALKPIADAMNAKGDEIYKECERFTSRRQ